VSYEDVDRNYITGDFSIGEQGGASAVTQGGGDADTVHTESERGPTGSDHCRARDADDMSSTPISDSNLNNLLNRFASAPNEVSGLSEASAAFRRNRGGDDGDRDNDSPHSHDYTAEGDPGNLSGSVILRAAPTGRVDTVQKLALQCSKLEYQNAQYVRIIAELQEQLSAQQVRMLC
jgi:hypothetical protein